MSKHPRPLSPHLTVYRPQITSVLSITHRITGLALYVGSLLLLAWLWSAAYHAECYRQLHDFMRAPLGRLMLLGWTAAYYYHFSNGLRHLWWDTGRGFSLPDVTRSGWAVIVLTVVLTAITWWRVLGGAS